MAHLELPEDESLTEINLTPLVDVALVLVIIFMTVAPFFSQTLRPLLLPHASQAGISDRTAIPISIYPDGQLAVSGTMVPASEFEARLKAELKSGQSPWAIVRADAAVPHGKVMDILKIAKAAGITRTGFATTPESKEAK